MDKELTCEIARKGHEIYERLAPDYGYMTRLDTKEFNPKSSNGRLMIAVYGEIISIVTQANEEAVINGIKDMANSPLVDDNDVPVSVYNFYMQGRAEAYAEAIKAAAKALEVK